MIKNHDTLLVLFSMGKYPRLESFLDVKEGRKSVYIIHI
jgi:hypothetical protein